MANAFEACTNLAKADEIDKVYRDIVLSRTPVKYFDVARTIQLVVTKEGQQFYPFAARHSPASVIVFPEPFAVFACRVAIANFLEYRNPKLKNLEKHLPQALKCIDQKQFTTSCFMLFSEQVARDYGFEYRNLPEKSRRMANGVAENLIAQLLMHEYSHHFLEHLKPNKTSVSVLANEFAADFFSIVNGLSAGDAPTAMNYLFSTLSHLTRRHSNTARMPTHENLACRFQNVTGIIDHIGLKALAIRRSVDRGSEFKEVVTPESVRKWVKDSDAQFNGSTPENYCGLLSVPALKVLSSEIHTLFDRIEPELDWLLSDTPKIESLRAEGLIADLAKMTIQFEYAGALAGNTVSRVLQIIHLFVKPEARERRLIQLALGPLSTESNAGMMLSSDFGRIRLYEAVTNQYYDISPETSENKIIAFKLYEQAVKYNPALAEGWANLMLLSIEHGRCLEAINFGEIVIKTSSSEDLSTSTRVILEKLRRLSADCKPL